MIIHPVRMLGIRSAIRPAALQRGVKIVDRQLLKDSQSELKAWQKLTRRTFVCQADAQTDLEAFQQGLKEHGI